DRPGKDSEGKKLARELLDGFESAMDNDLDTGRALRKVFSVSRRIEGMLSQGKIGASEAGDIVDAMERIDSVLGLFS
ncbi:MAG: hypothetical protein PHF60_03565, partial [Candidatus ainarchaeum sp.]|nr:hypothetical protein [Candidatus ainarchaeum sp.]